MKQLRTYLLVLIGILLVPAGASAYQLSVRRPVQGAVLGGGVKTLSVYLIVRSPSPLRYREPLV
jgi:hypothetical protein